MTTATMTLVHTNATDAEFRAWGGGLSAMLAAVGLVQTADTGQVNWTTVTKPGAINTVAGYEVWRFNDAQQSGAPIYLKVEYGSAAGSANNPRVTVTVGQGSNGSGTITGTTQQKVWSANGTLGTTVLSAVSLAEGCLSLSLAETGGGTYRPGVLQIGRFLDTAGAQTTRGYYFLFAATSAATTVHAYRTTTGVWTATSPIPIFWPYGATTSVKFGSGIFVAPYLVASGDNTHGALERTLGLVQAGTVDYPISQTFSMDRWDAASHTYRASGVADPSAAGSYFCVLWE